MPRRKTKAVFQSWKVPVKEIYSLYKKEQMIRGSIIALGLFTDNESKHFYDTIETATFIMDLQKWISHYDEQQNGNVAGPKQNTLKTCLSELHVFQCCFTGIWCAIVYSQEITWQLASRVSEILRNGRWKLCLCSASFLAAMFGLLSSEYQWYSVSFSDQISARWRQLFGLGVNPHRYAKSSHPLLVRHWPNRHCQ
jgi:hypothetical protein